MTPPTTSIETGMVRPTRLGELLALRQAGDTALDHCLRRVAEAAASGREDRVAAFNASPPRAL